VDISNYWGGHKLYSQTGAWGRHIYASTDWTYYDQNRLNSLYSYWQATNYQYVPTTIHFDDQAYGGGTHYSGLHATGWYYTNFPNPEYRSGDDDGDTRHEEIEVRWSPTFAAGGYNIEVEYWDPLYNDNTGVGNTGEVNVASYITTAIGWLRIGHQWMCKFYYPERDYLPWSFDCRA